MTLTNHQERMIYALRRYAQKGKRLADIAVPAIMNRVPDTLKRYCRLGRIGFPDYAPRNLRSAVDTPSAADTPGRARAPAQRAPAPLFDEASK